MFKSWYQDIPTTFTNTAIENMEIPLAIKTMFQELQLLYGVPLAYLIANEQLLPKESLRYFVVDENWVQALLEGFCSVGRVHPKDMESDALLLPYLFQQAALTKHHVRLQLLQQNITEKVSEEITTGVLLRSSLVELYKGLEVTTTTDASVNMIRMERLSNDILVCLFSGQLESICFSEPKESSTFGFLPDASLPIKDLKSGAIDIKRSDRILLEIDERKVNIEKLAKDLQELYYGKRGNEKVQASYIALALIKNQWEGRIQFVEG